MVAHEIAGIHLVQPLYATMKLTAHSTVEPYWLATSVGRLEVSILLT
jgi:hypothetical protein